jgi:surface carbohydrate biosynthesis protein
LKNNKKIVCIIVDNPSRDLDGLVLLARHLVCSNLDVYLVPMYYQNLEVPAIFPDLILVNFLRKENISLVKAYAHAGIKVVVMDTEGGIWESDDQFIKSIHHKESEKYISKYLFWGENQKKAFIKASNWQEHKLAVTGCQRYDLYNERFNNALSDSNGEYKNSIIFISNFGLAYPRYAKSTNVEISNMMNSGYDKDYCMKRVLHDRKCHENFIKIITQLANDFPEEKIILRCHPFEDESDYKIKLSSIPNVLVQRDGVVANLLKEAKFIFHLNSSVAIDAFLLGKCPYTLGWISTEITKSISSIPVNISKEITSYANLRNLIKQKNSEEDLVLPKDIEGNFYKCDGLNSERIANEINFLLKCSTTKKEGMCRKYLNYGVNFNAIYLFEALIRKVVGAKIYIYLRTNYLVKNPFKNRKRDKLFTVSRVNNFLKKINECSDLYIENKAIECTVPQRNMSLDNRGIGASIRLSEKNT